MKRDVLRHGTRVALALAFTVTLLAQPSFAAEFFAIVDNFGRRARNVYLDVAPMTVGILPITRLGTVLGWGGSSPLRLAISGRLRC
jgi:hypothetical protein